MLNVAVYGPQLGIPVLVMGIEANGDIDEYHTVDFVGWLTELVKTL